MQKTTISTLYNYDLVAHAHHMLVKQGVKCTVNNAGFSLHCALSAVSTNSMSLC